MRCRSLTRSVYAGEMGSEVSRYDQVADWYVEFTRSWGSEARTLLPEHLLGQRLLDMACGHGALSRVLARSGAVVTAVDLSSSLLAHATQKESTDRLGICYLCADATTTDWWDGNPFDGVVCNMALMDIDDLDAALSTVSAVLKRGGWFSFSLLHPCFPGGHDGSTEALPSWPPDRGYSSEGWWTTGSDGVRGHVGANHRKLSTYLDAVLQAGFDFVEFAEPASVVPRYFTARYRQRT